MVRLSLVYCPSHYQVLVNKCSSASDQLLCHLKNIYCHVNL